MNKSNVEQSESKKSFQTCHYVNTTTHRRPLYDRSTNGVDTYIIKCSFGGMDIRGNELCSKHLFVVF